MKSIGAAEQRNTTYTYDRTDNLTSVKDPRGLTTTYVRNGFGEVIQESGPDVGTTVITRDARGLATSITDPRGIVANLAYDNAGRLLSVSYPSATTQSVTYTYDSVLNANKGKGRLTGMTDGSGSTAWTYDALGRVTAETRVIAGKSYTVGYGYDAASRITKVIYPSGRIFTYARNALGQVTGATTQQTAAAAEQECVYLLQLKSPPQDEKLGGEPWKSAKRIQSRCLLE